ncbi:DUF6879 family protein [Dactylosporangium sp. NPDC000555]|uniref:DUF6879 family protein n=1 Tax=Dactylosporangium sp. NPDC000555 TaxID=3154260 RepID=UPI0033184CA4
MPDLLDGVDSELLTLDDYFLDFDQDFWSIEEGDFWKLERQQHFREPGDNSWRAFAEGNWSEALRLLEARRDDLADYYRRIAAHGFATFRVRVVEQPIIPYLQWELHLLRARERAGALIRVIGPDKIAELEFDGLVPEFATLGSTVLYEPVYDEQGVLVCGSPVPRPQSGRTLPTAYPGTLRRR